MWFSKKYESRIGNCFFMTCFSSLWTFQIRLCYLELFAYICQSQICQVHLVQDSCFDLIFCGCRAKYWSKIAMMTWGQEWFCPASTIPMCWYCKESKRQLVAIIAVEWVMAYPLMTLKFKVIQYFWMSNVSILYIA